MRWTIILPIALVVAVVVVVLAVAGGDSKSDKAMAQVCGARADIAAQVKSLQGLSLGSAREQAKTSLQAIAGDVRTIADARADLAEDRRGQVQAANDAFVSSVKDSVGSVTSLASLQTAGGQVRDAAKQLGEAYRTSYAKIDCSDT